MSPAIVDEMAHSIEVGLHDLYGMLGKEVGTGIAGSMYYILEMRVTLKRLEHIVPNKVKCRIVNIVSKALFCPPLVSSTGIHMVCPALAVHEHLHKA